VPATLSLLIVLPAVAWAEGGGGFAPGERERLSQGELVERRITERRGALQLMGGSSWQVIDAPPAVVWQALLDTPHYHRMLPQVLEAKLVSEREDGRTVYLRQGTTLVQTSYYLDLRVDHEQRDLSFRMDESRENRGIRAAWGFYNARPFGQHKTLLTYGVMADIGDGIVGAVMRPTVHEWMMKVPWMIKRFVEGSGRYLYKASPDDSPPSELPAKAVPESLAKSAGGSS
jgi:hypothetical protein